MVAATTAALTPALEAARAEVTRGREHAEARIADLRTALAAHTPAPAPAETGDPETQPSRPAPRRRSSRGGDTPDPQET